MEAKRIEVRDGGVFIPVDILTSIEAVEGLEQELVEIRASIESRLAELIGNAPEALDTIHEIAQALATNQNSVGTILTELTKKQEKIVAGNNITIDDNTINATDTKYAAGTNVTINASNVISATDTTYGLATASDNGLMPSTDKVKMDNIEVSGIRVYASTDTIPTLPNGVVALIYEV